MHLTISNMPIRFIGKIDKWKIQEILRPKSVIYETLPPLMWLMFIWNLFACNHITNLTERKLWNLKHHYQIGFGFFEH